jgi:phosphohistidine phosphatase SixA
MMEYLVVARHCHCENDGLTLYGKQQAEALARALVHRYGAECHPTILSSAKKRAVETARYIADEFKVPFISDWVFYENNAKEAVRYVLANLQDSKVIIVVTHFFESATIPKVFATETLNEEIRCGEVSYGQANILDCQTGKITQLTP